MPENGAFVTTIVTTELLKKIAASHHRRCFEVLTGFKYIGEKIHLWELSKEYQFLFGAEESYGYLPAPMQGTRMRLSPLASSQMALYAKLQEQTLIDRLHHIYATYGIFRDKQSSLGFPPGKEGMQQMGEVMQRLRSEPPSALAETPIIYIEVPHPKAHFFRHKKNRAARSPH